MMTVIMNSKNGRKHIDWWQKLTHNWKKTLLFNLDFTDIDYGSTDFFPDLYNTYYKKFGFGIRKRLDDFKPTDENLLRILNLEKIIVKHPEFRNVNPLQPLKNIKTLLINGTELTNLKNLDCPNLENLVLSCPDLDSLEGIENLKSLKSLRLIYCRKIKDFDYVFECESIQSIDLEYLGTVEGIKSFIDAFYRQKKENSLPFYKNKLSKMVKFPNNIDPFDIWYFRE